jgi:integrase
MSKQQSTFDRHGYQKTRHRGLSYRFLADGSRRYYGYVPGRGRVPLSGSGEREALSAYGDLRGRAARGEKIAPANVRFRDLAEEWLESKHRLRPSTRRNYRESLDLVLLPRFGHLKLGAIDASLIARLIRELERRGLNAIDSKRPVRPLSASSVENHLKPLNGVLQLAIRRGLLSANPYSALSRDERPQKAEYAPAHEWSDQEIEALLSAAEERSRQRDSRYDYAPLIRTAVYTGLRLGELLGLKWADLDLERGLLHVRRQWTKQGELASPKTPKSVRRVPLSPDMVASLRRYKLASRFSQETDSVFASRTGGPLGHRNVQRRGFEPARDVAELPKSITFHDLRHAFASLAAHRGVPVTVLSEVMGHSHVGVTQKVYMHLFGREQAEDAFRAAMAQDGRA